MKQYRLFLSALALGFLSSCADDLTQNLIVENVPLSVQVMEELNRLDPLKSYKTASNMSPNFKLGGALTATDFIAGGNVGALAAANLDEIVAGNAMKCASVVDNNGNMDFSTVKNFVNAAKKAGVGIYGHTLAWHAQQPKKWLEKLIKDKELDIDPDAKIEKLISSYSYENKADGPFPHYVMGCEPPIVNGALHYEPTPDAEDPEKIAWAQFFVLTGDDNVLTEGDYVARVYMTASNDANGLELTIQNGWSNAQSLSASFAVKEGEQVYELQFSGITAEPSGKYDVILKPQTANVTLDFKKIEIYKLESPAVEVENEVTSKTYTDGPFPFFAMGCEPPVVGGAIHFVPTGDWSQFFCFSGGENTLTEGDYVVYLDIQSDKDASGIQFTMQNGWGKDAQNVSVAVPVKSGRDKYKLSFPGILGGDYDCILKPQTSDATLDLYSVTICKIEKLNSIPLTVEEKKDTLTWAMKQWVEGMMEATGGYVKAWDVVNEAISGGGNVDGLYALQHADNANGDNGVSADFFWQDYLGDLDYVRTVVAAAREFYKGDAADLKLFINDYNLESDWDDNKKATSLVGWIGKWEEDGVTKIDGIGTQMHITCYEDDATNERKKEHIAKMFEILAASGKLVRVSELDMGFQDASGKQLQTEELTDAQHQKMAELYKYVIKTYLEKVPQAQQYGICQWCLTDSPKSSSWRKGEPTGLWTEKYVRKQTYQGFADGLSGK